MFKAAFELLTACIDSDGTYTVRLEYSLRNGAEHYHFCERSTDLDAATMRVLRHWSGLYFWYVQADVNYEINGHTHTMPNPFHRKDSGAHD
jgi:hypothetical protein